MQIPNNKDLTTIAKDVESGLKSFNKKKAEFKAMKAEAQKIKITDISDKPLIKAADLLRKKLKSARCEVSRQSKDLQQPLANLVFMIKEKEKELIAIIEPHEKDLQQQQQWVADEHEKIKQAEQDRLASLVNDRINQLSAFGFSVDTETLAGLDQETFDAVLDEARQQFEQEQQLKAKQDHQGQPPAETVDDLYRHINDIMTEEKEKMRHDDHNLMIDLNKTFEMTMHVNPVLFEERKRLVIYATHIAAMIDLHSPQMATIEGNDIIATANELLKKVHLMLMQAVEQI